MNMRELSRWLHALAAGAVIGLYDYLSTPGGIGTATFKTIVLAVAVRALGYAIARLGPKPDEPVQKSA